MQSSYPNVTKKDLKVLHYQQLHDDLLSYCIAPSCGKAFVYQREMQKHYKRSHLKVKHQCQFCPRKFSSNEWIRMHNEENHPEKIERPFSFHCQHSSGCQAKYTSAALLNLHMASRHLLYFKPRPKKVCPVCGEYRSASGLKEHMLLVHGQGAMSVPCDLCDKSYPSIKLLKKHVKDSHLGGKRVNATCTICGKVLRKHLMRKHILVVHEKIRHHCTKCEKSFALAYDLEWHIKAVHLGIKPKCKFCPMEFGRPADRNRHEKQCNKARLEMC